MKVKFMVFLFAAITAQSLNADQNIVESIMKTQSVKNAIDFTTTYVSAPCIDSNANLSPDERVKVCNAVKTFNPKKQLESEFRLSMESFFKKNPSEVEKAKNALSNERALSEIIYTPMTEAGQRVGIKWAASLQKALQE